MLKYFIGAAAGGAIGFFVLYKLIGCSSGSCPITANPYISTIYGIILGVLVAGMITLPSETKGLEQITEPQTTISNETVQIPVIEYIKITAKEAKARIDSGDNIIILDVRTAAEYESGHIQGAILITNETITNKKPELLPDLNAEILIYCRSG
ncbi:rhodanese-like domain-containing protein, partial [Petrimonas sp.]|uniref:rhodanese-like domain-containing protein n=1 Tax=Petrimonas sp. TaxID=2023866 RepID=UPI003F519F3D